MFRKFAALYALVRQDVRTLWHALRHPARPAWLRPAVALVALYLFTLAYAASFITYRLALAWS